MCNAQTQDADSAVDNQTQTLNLTEFREELRAQIHVALTAPANTVTLLQPPPGSGKTWICSEEVALLPDGMRVAVLAQTHSLAEAEWEKRIPNSLRLMSLARMCKEGILDCPFKTEIAEAQSRRLPYYRLHCAGCEKFETCEYHRRQDAAKDAKALVCQHAHLPTLTNSGLSDGRIIVIDECPAKWVRSRVEYTPEKFESFGKMLSGFELTGEADATVLASIRHVVSEIQSVPAGQSRTMNDSGSVLWQADAFRAKFNSYLSDTRTVGWNLLPDITDIACHRGFVRRPKDGAEPRWWSVRSNLPSNDKPVVVLDATGTRPLYEALFPGRKLVVWPDDRTYAPKSCVTVFLDGMYCQSSLCNTEVDPPRATETFDSILGHIEKIIKHHAVPMDNIGAVTLLKLVDPFMRRFPEITVLHYGDLRGRNEGLRGGHHSRLSAGLVLGSGWTGGDDVRAGRRSCRSGRQSRKTAPESANCRRPFGRADRVRERAHAVRLGSLGKRGSRPSRRPRPRACRPRRNPECLRVHQHGHRTPCDPPDDAARAPEVARLRDADQGRPALPSHLHALSGRQAVRLPRDRRGQRHRPAKLKSLCYQKTIARAVADFDLKRSGRPAVFQQPKGA